ncbi:hypothetical protein SJ05684_b56310 (plasmid) [Sinorhizobium sojae CCBAU 05684]|uniref:DUF982 domain-containing protein n=1 Tax=Sinorhizobium sojae CCBAU 05684 TaxID=716928 RepID=A0A249PL05_9HYPH|nr:DUF982 domain-containing protein [Sinorhizobium sojae]ASY66613.1 hypothetical protein SJ05684_b56310 [Sinorhizobium sojae CCBAU 05684]
MEWDQFRHPVTILVGLGFPVDISSVREAYALLNERQPSKRNQTHAIALNACRAALAGEMDVETARGAFVAFVQQANVLAPATDAVPVARVHSTPFSRASGKSM